MLTRTDSDVAVPCFKDCKINYVQKHNIIYKNHNGYTENLVVYQESISQLMNFFFIVTSLLSDVLILLEEI